jgi:hypothetical protein
MADVTIANIVLQKPQSQELASAFREYALQNAELVAKKELALMGIAINNAAAKGSTSIAYKPSRDFTVLQGEFYNKAVEIINADLRAAEYSWKVTYKNDYAVGFEFSWGDGESSNTPADNSDDEEEEELNELPDPVTDPEQSEPEGE